MKTCRKCGVASPAHLFYKDLRTPDGLKGECKQCLDSRTKEWKRNKRKSAIAALGGKCSHCGNDDPRVLQIDHIDGGGNADRKKSRISILNRIISGSGGFQLLCANCHCIKSFDNGEYGNDADCLSCDSLCDSISGRGIG